MMDAPTYDEGEALGCPTCAAGEPHVCPFVTISREIPEPRRSAALTHMRDMLNDNG